MQDPRKPRTVNKGCSILLRPRAFPMAPKGHVTEVQFIPPKIKHLRIEMQDACTRYTCGRRNQLEQPVIDTAAVSLGNACKQMPQGEGVALPRLREHNRKRCCAFILRSALAIERRECSAERVICVFEVRCAWPSVFPGVTRSSGGYKGFVASQLESHPAQSCT